MKKKTIRLTENDLHRIVKNAVRHIIKEGFDEISEEDYQDYISKYEEIIDDAENVPDSMLKNAIDDFENNYQLRYDETSNDIYNASKDEYAIRNRDYAMSYKTPENKFMGKDMENRNVFEKPRKYRKYNRSFSRYDSDYGKAEDERTPETFNYDETDVLNTFDEKPWNNRKTLNRNVPEK